MAEVVFVDSSVLLNLLNLLDVPGKNSDRGGVTTEFKAHAASGVTLIIPMAAVVEVGNHIAQLPGHDRRDRATRFVGMLRASLDGRAPWLVSGAGWDDDFLTGMLAGKHQLPGLVDLCSNEIGSGDASILHELYRYRSRTDLPGALPVRLWTLDRGLAAYA